MLNNQQSEQAMWALLERQSEQALHLMQTWYCENETGCKNLFKRHCSLQSPGILGSISVTDHTGLKTAKKRSQNLQDVIHLLEAYARASKIWTYASPVLASEGTCQCVLHGIMDVKGFEFAFKHSFTVCQGTDGQAYIHHLHIERWNVPQRPQPIPQATPTSSAVLESPAEPPRASQSVTLSALESRPATMHQPEPVQAVRLVASSNGRDGRACDDIEALPMARALSTEPAIESSDRQPPSPPQPQVVKTNKMPAKNKSKAKGKMVLYLGMPRASA